MSLSEWSHSIDLTCLTANDEVALEKWFHQILMEAMSCQAEQRRAFIEAACQGHDEYLTTLLGRLADAESFETHYSVSIGEPLWTHVGVYRLDHELGRGGMGVVYHATREDDFNMQVAIKLVRAGQDCERSVAAFHRERQILASLQHPYIAQIYDGGTTKDGCPYLVMEHVDGQSLTQWLNSESPSLNEALEVFIKICEAVSFAHENMVIHRDLKPHNIMITAEGRPKLLDFGIASVLEQESTIPAVSVQDQEGRLTPEYACPEQITGQRLTAAADVYALGAILYEVLSGCLPHRFKTTNPQEWCDKICNEEPLKVGAALRLRHKHKDREHWGRLPSWRRLSRDLDAVVAKALAKDPRERYGSAGALARDLGRYLARRPVEARRAPRAHQLGRWLTRNWVPISAFLLLAGVALTAWLERNQALAARDQAERARRGALQESEFLQDVLRQGRLERDPNQPLSVPPMLETAAMRLELMDDKEPLTRARLFLAMGELFQSYGDFQRADSLLEHGLALRYAAAYPVDALLIQLKTQRAAALRGMDRVEESYALLQQAAVELEQLPDTATWLRAETALQISQTTFDLERLEEAEIAAHRVIHLVDTLDGGADVPIVAAQDPTLRCASLYGPAYRLLAAIAERRGESVTYDQFLNQALNYYCRIESQDPVVFQVLSMKAAQHEAAKGDLVAAAARYRHLDAAMEQGRVRIAPEAKATVFDGMLGLLLDQEQGDTALARLAGAGRAGLSLPDEHVALRQAQADLAAGRTKRALRGFKRLQETRDAAFYHPAFVETYLTLGRLDEARSLALGAIEPSPSGETRPPAERAAYYRMLATIAHQNGEFEVAVAYQQQAKALMETHGMWDMAWGGQLRVEMAGTALALGRDADAAGLLKEATPLIQHHFQQGHSVHVLHRRYWEVQLAHRGVRRQVVRDEDSRDIRLSPKAKRLLNNPLPIRGESR